MRSIVFALVLSAATVAEAATSFDGSWTVTLKCEAQPKVKPFTYIFKAEIKDGKLSGQYGAAGQPSSMSLVGPVTPDGTAKLVANGLVGNPDYAAKNVARNTAYSYEVTARFTETRGEGDRIGGRACKYTFVKD